MEQLWVVVLKEIVSQCPLQRELSSEARYSLFDAFKLNFGFLGVEKELVETNVPVFFLALLGE